MSTKENFERNTMPAAALRHVNRFMSVLDNECKTDYTYLHSGKGEIVLMSLALPNSNAIYYIYSSSDVSYFRKDLFKTRVALEASWDFNLAILDLGVIEESLKFGNPQSRVKLNLENIPTDTNLPIIVEAIAKDLEEVNLTRTGIHKYALPN